MPAFFAELHANKGTPVYGLLVSFGLVAALLLSGRMGLALGIAVVALMLLYALHSVALLVLPGLESPRYEPIRVITFHTRTTAKFYGDYYAVESPLDVPGGG